MLSVFMIAMLVFIDDEQLVLCIKNGLDLYSLSVFALLQQI